MSNKACSACEDLGFVLLPDNGYGHRLLRCMKCRKFDSDSLMDEHLYALAKKHPSVDRNDVLEQLRDSNATPKIMLDMRDSISHLITVMARASDEIDCLRQVVNKGKQ